MDMSEYNELTIEDKIYNLFQFALQDDGTTITFYNQLESFKDVVMLGHYGIALSIFRSQFDEDCMVYSEKWEKKFPKIYNLISNYNALINNYISNEKPLKYNVEELDDLYEDIFDAVSSKYTKLNRFLYGEPWVVSKKQSSMYYIKMNQLSYRITKEAYENLLNLSINEEKNRNTELVDDLISQYLNAENDDAENTIEHSKTLNTISDLNIDDLLDKISKSGFDSLNDDEIEFLKNNRKN